VSDDSGGSGGNGDDEFFNTDWPKLGTWDLWNPDGSRVETLKDLMLNLRVNEGQTDVDALRAFMSLPAWQPAPEALKQEAYDYLHAMARRAQT